MSDPVTRMTLRQVARWALWALRTQRGWHHGHLVQVPDVSRMRRVERVLGLLAVGKPMLAEDRATMVVEP